MPYIPNTDKDRKTMLEKIGVTGFDELLKSVPDNIRLKEKLKLPGSLSELELLAEIEKISCENKCHLVNFAGGGLYDHFIPAAMENLLSRPEFVTAYTPYQAEVSQGTLQIIYEFQTHICRLTGMDAANASMYDGASAAAEAASLSLGKTRRSKVVISETVNPLYRDVVRTYLSGHNVEIVIIPQSAGTTDFERLKATVDDSTACVILSQPNYFGLIEDIEIGAELVHGVGGLLALAIDPIAATLLKTPGDCGADIVVGEGQSLGIPLNYGGPLLGFFAVRKELIRQLPGRLAARTEDEVGNPGFVLTLQTREQHIRREKATSNICTNQALCATMATIYMSLMGKSGLKQVALLSMDRAYRTFEKILDIPGFAPYFNGSFVREFAVRTPVPAGDIINKMAADKSILPGIDLSRYYSGMDNALMIAVTEKRTEDDIEKLGLALKEYSTDAVLSKM
jgi:glycine dehydrogenase subunit 1